MSSQLISLQRDYTEQEQTLIDLGSHVSESKLRLKDMETKQRLAKDKSWADDRAVTECQGCTKVFNVTRRSQRQKKKSEKKEGGKKRRKGCVDSCTIMSCNVFFFFFFFPFAHPRFVVGNTIAGDVGGSFVTCVRTTRCRCPRRPSPSASAIAARRSCCEPCTSIDHIMFNKALMKNGDAF